MKQSFEERHGDNISKLKLVLIVVCLIAIPVTFWVNHSDVGSVNSRVTRVESPCLRFGAKSKQCRKAFEQAVLTITHAQACAILRKAGLEIVNCAGARLKQEHGRHEDRAKAKRGDADQTPSTGHQQPGPSGGQPGHVGGGEAEQPTVPGASEPTTPQKEGVKPPNPQQGPTSEALPPIVREPPLGPVLAPPTPPAAAPAVEHACEKAAAVAAVC